MDHLLAKELKDAGFPQMQRDGCIVSISQEDTDEPPLDITAYAPTLEELIEACGPQFEDLRRVEYPRGATEGYKPKVRWEASTAFEVGEGSTPTIAVGKLLVVLLQAKQN